MKYNKTDPSIKYTARKEPTIKSLHDYKNNRFVHMLCESKQMQLKIQYIIYFLFYEHI